MSIVPRTALAVGQRRINSRPASTAKWAGLVLVILAALYLPYATTSFGVNLATQALIFGLFALSINILSGYGGMVTLGQAGLLGAAGYALGIFTVHDHVPLGVALIAALGVAVVVSAFFGALAVRTRGTYFVMITLAEGMVVWGIAQRWQELTGGENGITGIPKPSFTTEYWQYYYLVLAVVAVCTVLIAFLVRSPFGLSLRGIREAEERLPSLGYNVTLHKLIAFTIAGAFAGVAGLLLAMFNNFIGPSNVFFLASAQGLLMSILGGVGTLTGAFIGSSIVVVIQDWVSSFFPRWETLLGVIFVVVILFAPDGIVGAWRRWVWSPLIDKLRSARAAPKEAVAVTTNADAQPEKAASLSSDDRRPTSSSSLRAGSTEGEENGL